MNDIAVEVRNLGKRYRIGALDKGRRTLRETLTDALASPFRKAGSLLSGNASGAAGMEDEIWALKDVSFQVPRGQVLGIIGKNGAGKSTLLKILSRITEPTEGFVEIRGRVGSLLEVGTGFHPELTGRENVYLNGAILGMPRTEIDRKFDEIVEFAEVERFLDTPVKYYSSGMYVRLAFAVAAHLEPEILVVDEVLSVGDAQFRRKCLGKMGDVATSGRTVLFVSHNMSTITELCDRTILVHGGGIIEDGEAVTVVGHYLSMGAERTSTWTRPEEADDSDRAIEFQSVRILDADGQSESIVPFTGRPGVEIRYRVNEPVRGAVILCSVRNEQGTALWTSWDVDDTGRGGKVREPGEYRGLCRMPEGLLRPGQYYVTVGADIPHVRLIEAQSDVVSFEVSPVGYPFNLKRHGVITPRLDWDVERSGSPMAQSSW